MPHERLPDSVQTLCVAWEALAARQTIAARVRRAAERLAPELRAALGASLSGFER